MMMVPRVEKTMKDILSMGLQKDGCLTLTQTSKQDVHILQRLVQRLPDEFLCHLLHEGVNFYPVMLHASRSEE